MVWMVDGVDGVDWHFEWTYLHSKSEVDLYRCLQ